MAKAIYSLSADPITYGHIDIIKRAANVFDQVIVALGVNPKKKYLFSLSQRLELAKNALADLNNVEVVSFEGLLVDFAYEIKADAIVKGVRNSSDFEYENSLLKMGQSQDINIDTFILVARPELAHISSSNVKQIQREQGLIHDYVPLNVKQTLEIKMSQQYIVAVTGEIGSGKTYISELFTNWAQQHKIRAHHLDLDLIAHHIYQDLPQPIYQSIRETIACRFGQKVQNQDGSINRKVLGEIVFNDYQKLQELNSIMQQPLLVRIRRELYGKKGLILLNAALIAESHMTYISNNHVCLIKTDKDSQKQRLLKRDLSEDQIQRRLKSQYTHRQKKSFLAKIIRADNFGHMWEIDNSQSGSIQNHEKVFGQILKYFELA